MCLGEWHGGKAGGDVLRLFHPQLVLDPIPFQLTTQILQPLLVRNLGQNYGIEEARYRYYDYCEFFSETFDLQHKCEFKGQRTLEGSWRARGKSLSCNLSMC